MTANHKPKLLFIFAHPDDDAFGPAGSLIKMSREYDMYFLCATKGESGQNALDGSNAIGEIREKEVIASSQVIGAKDIHFLGFRDGDLCNNNYHQIVNKVQHYVVLYKPEVLVTWEPRGVSGHIDHIVMSMVTHFVFYHSPCVRRLMLYCLSEYQTHQFLDNYFVYRPPGYKRSDIDLVYDISDVWDRKIQAIRCHKSQVADMKKVLNRPKVRMMEDCYQIITKNDLS